MMPRQLISGPPLCGFEFCFEEGYGDPSTPEPYARVVPSRVGRTLLPFPCPRCGKVVEVTELEKYKDARPGRGNHWCPECGWRFYLDEEGVPLTTTLQARADHAPAKVSA